MPRFFSSSSFWNQPIAADAATDPCSGEYLDGMRRRDPRGLWINLDRWTIPIYEVGPETPRRQVHRRLTDDSWVMRRCGKNVSSGHPRGFHADFARDADQSLIPIPDHAAADPQGDCHLALVDWHNGWAWDMWGARRRPDGQWESNTGMKYRIDGAGVFDRSQFVTHNGESIHAHGPGRAAGVPILAGTILHAEVLAGRIEHKLAFATQAAGLQAFVYPPACWTDGGWRGGLPEGATLQLDPTLDLRQLGLSPAAQVIARALQEYGAVCVDVAGGHVLYGEGLYGHRDGRTWNATLGSADLIHIGLEHYRVLRTDGLVSQGMGPRVPDGFYADAVTAESPVGR